MVFTAASGVKLLCSAMFVEGGCLVGAGFGAGV